MDVFQTVSGYITKMISAGDSGVNGGTAKMKILLLDRDTVSLCNLTCCHVRENKTYPTPGAYRFLCNHPIDPSQPLRVPHGSP
jgi:hypothetical protein